MMVHTTIMSESDAETADCIWSLCQHHNNQSNHHNHNCFLYLLPLQICSLCPLQAPLRSDLCFLVTTAIRQQPIGTGFLKSWMSVIISTLHHQYFHTENIVLFWFVFISVFKKFLPLDLGIT